MLLNWLTSIAFTRSSLRRRGESMLFSPTPALANLSPLALSPKKHFDKLFNINVRGTLFTVQKALPLLKDGGSIILNGSVASVKGTAAFGVYAASKAAIRSLVRT